MTFSWFNRHRRSIPQKCEVICIMGAARTGTHLLNSTICQSGQTNPMLPESLHVVELAKFHERLEKLAHRYPDMYYTTDGEVAKTSAPMLRQMAEDLCTKYNVRKCVFRAPSLSWHAQTLYQLLEHESMTFQFVCMLRDPRDAVASMIKWNEKRLARGEKPLHGEDQDIVDYAIRHFWSQYKPLIEIKNYQNIQFVKYEDLTAHPEKTVAQIYTYLGLDITKFQPDCTWQNVKADLSPTSRNADCITELYQKPISTSSVGAYQDMLSHDQMRSIMGRLKGYMEIFYPETLSTYRRELR